MFAFTSEIFFLSYIFKFLVIAFSFSLKEVLLVFLMQSSYCGGAVPAGDVLICRTIPCLAGSSVTPKIMRVDESGPPVRLVMKTACDCCGCDIG